MAMRATEHGPDQRGLPPPLGPALHKQVKAKVLQFPNVVKDDNLNPLLKGLRASLPARSLSDLEFACEYRIIQARAQSKSSSSGSGSGGGKEWRPSWNKDYGGGIALWNLLANAELMTPVGRKFIPNPRYNGNGLSPPQKDPLATHFNNVVELSEVRTKAVEKTLHSERSRGKVHPIIGGPPEPLDVGPVQQTKVSPVVQSNQETTEVGVLDLSAYGWPAANEDMLSGNTDEEELPPSIEEGRYDRMCENLAYFAYNVGTQLSIDGVYKLSPSCTVEAISAAEMTLEFQLKSGYKAVRRMRVDDFFYRLDDNGLPFKGYLWDDEVPTGLMDELTWEIFNFPIVHDWFSHEGFETWSAGDLAKLYHWHNHSSWERGVEIEAVFNGVNQPVSQSELWVWEGEAYEEHYRKEYDNICNLRHKHKAFLQSMTRYKVFHKAEIKRGFPGAKQLNDDNRYKKYWLEQYVYDEEFRYEYRLAVGRPVLVRPDAIVPDFSIGHPTLVKKVKVKAVRAWNKMVDVLNTPVTKLFSKKAKLEVKQIAEPVVPYEVDSVKVNAVAEGLAVRMIYLGSLHDDQYDLEWLEKMAGRRLDLNKPLPDPVELAIQAVKQDVPTEEFSEGGVYLGKRVQLPRTEAGLILPTHMPHS